MFDPNINPFQDPVGFLKSLDPELLALIDPEIIAKIEGMEVEIKVERVSGMQDLLDMIYEDVRKQLPDMSGEFACLTTISMNLEALTHNLCEMGIEGEEPDLVGLIDGLMETIIWMRSKEAMFLNPVEDFDWESGISVQGGDQESGEPVEDINGESGV